MRRLAGSSLLVLSCASSPTAPEIPVAPHSTRTQAEHECARAAHGEIRRVIVRGAVDAAAACAKIGQLPGADFDRARVRSDIEVLFATRTFDDVRVLREGSGDTAALVFELTPRPRLGNVDFEGGDDPLLKDAIETALSSRPSTVEPAWLKQTEQSLAGALDKGGFPSAAVSVSRTAGTTSDIHFAIRPGPKATIDELKFVGLQKAKEHDLRVQMGVGVGPGQRASLETIRRTRYIAEGALADFGLLEGTVRSDVRFSSDRTLVNVTFNVEEGRVFNVAGVRLGGRAKLDEKLTKPYLQKLVVGKPYNNATVLEVERALSELGSEGDAPVNVETKLDIPPNSTDVKIEFVVTPR